MKKLSLMKGMLFCLILSGLSVIVGGISSANTGSRFAAIAWNDLGMHCMDRDYSVFAILPPYNNLQAQVIDKSQGGLVGSDVSLLYEATKDTHKSINTTSYKKSNFWDWVLPIFGIELKPDVGLADNSVQSKKRAPLTFDSAIGQWKALGIPTVPYDDKGKTNCYPMVKVTAKDLKGRTLATTKTVLPVSDEMTCVHCHASVTGDPAAEPASGWINDPNTERDWKRNILLRHDDKNASDPLYAVALNANGYAASGLAATAGSGTPILCANCHSSNALGKPGISGVKQLTTAVHSFHAINAMDDNTGMPLDQTTDRSACYYCHPGSTTQCLRGVMGTAKDSNGDLLLQCQSCHGAMSKVGDPARVGWKDLPSCQGCHYWSDSTSSYVRDTSAFDQSGNFRQGTSIFTTGSDLFKLGTGHGGVRCEACHGSTHAEYPSAEANDNVQSIQLQGYAGQLRECSTCHSKSMAVTKDGGPHGMHTVGQIWVNSHAIFAGTDRQHCETCHGSGLSGTFLSKTSTKRVFRASDQGKKTFSQGQIVSCSACHSDPWNGN